MSEVALLLEQLVATESINPDLVSTGSGEGDVARLIANWCEGQGLEVHWLETTPGRPSVVAVARGSGGGRSLLFDGHIDTVGVSGMSDPFRPRIENGRMYGRGAYDMKAGVAAMLVAVAKAKALNLRGDVLAACVADEEYASLGSFEVVSPHQGEAGFRADAVVVTEPSSLQTVTAHKGFVWAEIEVHGQAAHGSRPDLGVDAIAKMGKVLVEIERLGLELCANPSHPLLGSGSVHASLIQGGQELSSYPARCKLAIERRTVPGETLEVVEGQLRQILESIKAADPHFNYTLSLGLERKPHQTPEDAAILQTLQDQAERVLGSRPQIKGEPFWTDCAVFSGVGIPTVLFGPHGAGAHAVEEWVDLQSVEQCVEIYLGTIREFCA